MATGRDGPFIARPAPHTGFFSQVIDKIRERHQQEKTLSFFREIASYTCKTDRSIDGLRQIRIESLRS